MLEIPDCFSYYILRVLLVTLEYYTSTVNMVINVLYLGLHVITDIKEPEITSVLFNIPLKYNYRLQLYHIQLGTESSHTITKI